MDETVEKPQEKPALPKLAELKITADDKREWAQLPATRAWFKSIQVLAEQIATNALSAYDRTSADCTLSRLAEKAGAARVLWDLLNQQDEAKNRLFSQEDLEEVL